jgi:hypothetical protein
MKYFLEFTFQNGWHYFGVLALIIAPIAVLGNAIGDAINAFRKK